MGSRKWSVTMISFIDFSLHFRLLSLVEYIDDFHLSLTISTKQQKVLHETTPGIFYGQISRIANL